MNKNTKHVAKLARKTGQKPAIVLAEGRSTEEDFRKDHRGGTKCFRCYGI